MLILMWKRLGIRELISQEVEKCVEKQKTDGPEARQKKAD